MALIALVACQKEEPKEEPKEIILSGFTITPSVTEANISLKATCQGKLWATLSLSPNADMSHATTQRLDKDIIADMPYPFEFSVSNLDKNTDYWCQIEVSNELSSTSTEIKQFTTLSTHVEVITREISEVSQTAASCRYTVNINDDSHITAHGACWSTTSEPTTIDSHCNGGEGAGTFMVPLTDLMEATTYHVRSYAIIDDVTYYGNEKTFTTLAPPTMTEGSINGLYTADEFGNQIYFSRGNLQYRASTNTWRFAEHQWDIVGEDNANISPTYDGWIDLFGWATSGFNHGSPCYQPWSTSVYDNDYYAYNHQNNNNYNLFDRTGMADWGYNAISNGGNQLNLWRTPKLSEFMYIFFYRTTPSGIHYAKANVGEMNGVLLVPDDWDAETYQLYSTDTYDAQYCTNIISASDWTDILEPAGCVFLPAAGCRTEYFVQMAGLVMSYWYSTVGDELYGYDNDLVVNYASPSSSGESVRLISSF